MTKQKLENQCTFYKKCKIKNKTDLDICYKNYGDCIQYETIIENFFKKYIEKEMK